jgi:hypothetical protein
MKDKRNMVISSVRLYQFHNVATADETWQSTKIGKLKWDFLLKTLHAAQQIGALEFFL